MQNDFHTLVSIALERLITQSNFHTIAKIYIMFTDASKEVLPFSFFVVI